MSQQLAQPEQMGTQRTGQQSAVGQTQPMQGQMRQQVYGGQQWSVGQQGQQIQDTMLGQPEQLMGMTLDQALTDELRMTLDVSYQVLRACEWCAERCLDHGPEMSECVRLCRDTAELAALNAKLIARDSMFGPDIAQTFVEAADACAQECSKHSESHCQECAQVLSQAVQTTESMLASLGQGGMTGQHQGIQSTGARTQGQGAWTAQQF